MEHVPLISVIVPVYKVEAYLDKCIASIVNQTYTNLEIILVDDGSPDNCPAMCDAWAAKDSRIRVIHKENGGSAQARNVALDVASGEYIAFADSDDMMNVDMIRSLYDVATTQGADIVECDYSFSENEALATTKATSATEMFEPQAAMIGHIRDRIFRQIIWNKLYRAEVVETVRFVEGKVIDDEFWTFKAIGNAGKLARIDRKLYFYRQQDDSVMHQRYSLNRLASIEAKKQRLKYIQDNMPQLESAARLNLYGSCIYAGQMSLMHLSREQLASAKRIINDALGKSRPSISECFTAEGSNKVWFMLARIFFWPTCRLKNVLGKGL